MPPARLTVYACAALVAASIAYGILRIPVQVRDALDEILAVQRSPGVWAAFTSTIGDASNFRPLRIAETKALLELSGGHYFAAYKGFHIALVIAVFALFLGELSIETWTDAAAALFALTVFTGLHTFLGFVREAFPVNHFLQVAVLVLVVVRLSRARPGPLVDVAANVAFVAACLTLESGVLVWVAAVAARIAGRRGISDRALIVMTGLLGVYLVARTLSVAQNPQGMAQDSGYFFERLQPPDIRQRFGNGLSRFSAYNVLAAIGSVLFSEPRGGVMVFFRAWSFGDIPPRMWINVVSSTLTTILMLVAVDKRQPHVVIFVAVLLASAAASFLYVKDEVLSAAGVFYAIAAFWAVRELITRRTNRAAAALIAVALLIAGSGWSLRTIGVSHVLRAQAFAVHNDWSIVPSSVELRNESLNMPVVNPWFVPRWADRVFEGDY